MVCRRLRSSDSSRFRLQGISQGHAKVLVGLDNAHFLARKIIDKKLSVRQAENLIRTLKNQKGNLVHPGLYFYTVEASGVKNKIGKFVIIR